MLFIKEVNEYCLVMFESAAAPQLIKWSCFNFLRATVSTPRLDLHPEAVHTDLGVGGSIWHGWQIRPDLQCGVPALCGKAVRAMWVERRLCPPAGWPDGEDGDGSQSSPKHQLHVQCGGFERRVGAAAQQEVLHPGQRVDQPAWWVGDVPLVRLTARVNIGSKKSSTAKSTLFRKGSTNLLKMGQSSTPGWL